MPLTNHLVRLEGRQRLRLGLGLEGRQRLRLGLERRERLRLGLRGGRGRG